MTLMTSNSLELMSSEARGIDPEPDYLHTWPISLSPALPRNVNDDFLSTHKQGLRTQAGDCEDGVSEMTMSLVRFAVSACFRRLTTMPFHAPNFNDENPQSQQEKLTEMEKYIDETVDRLNHLYLRHCRHHEPSQMVTLELGRLAQYKARLVFYHRFKKREEDGENGNPWSPARKK